jgi:hypothetical protein
MSLSSQYTEHPVRPSAYLRAEIEAEAIISEHAATRDPDRIDTVALKLLLLFSPKRPPNMIDLMVVDALRARAAAVRAERKC